MNCVKLGSRNLHEADSIEGGVLLTAYCIFGVVEEATLFKKFSTKQSEVGTVLYNLL